MIRRVKTVIPPATDSKIIHHAFFCQYGDSNKYDQQHRKDEIEMEILLLTYFSTNNYKLIYNEYETLALLQLEVQQLHTYRII